MTKTSVKFVFAPSHIQLHTNFDHESLLTIAMYHHGETL